LLSLFFQLFWLFLLLRGVVGIGEASYSTVAPTIIADMFINVIRSRVLMLFYFAIPVGAGLGYVVGAKVAAAFQNWQWGIR
jgi:MFS family permease